MPLKFLTILIALCATAAAQDAGTNSAAPPVPTVALVIPTAAPHANFGAYLQKVFAFSVAHRSLGVNVVVKPVEEFEALAADPSVVAVVSPPFIGQDAAEALAARAQHHQLPLLALTHATGLKHAGSFVFEHGLTVAAQLETLIAFFAAEGNPQPTRFAILQPDAPFPKYLETRFREKFAAAGYGLSTTTTYRLDQTTYTKEMKALAKTLDYESRPEYKVGAAECAKKHQGDAYRQRKCAERVQRALPPLLDFDALFIADAPKRLSMILPALNVEDIVTTHDEARLKVIAKVLKREIRPVRLVGLDTWNSPDLLRFDPHHFEGSIFVAGLDRHEERPLVRAFIEAFKELFHREPDTLDGTIYDAVLWLKAALAREDSAGREGLRQALEAARGSTELTTHAGGKIMIVRGGKTVPY